MKVKIIFNKPFVFDTTVKVRISDINYGGHVGNDSILSIIHEVRLAYLNQWEYNEMNAGGCGLIMADSAIQYKGEAFHGDLIHGEIYAELISSVAFDLYYKLSVVRNENTFMIAYAKTAMITYDYSQRKIIPVSTELLEKLSLQSEKK